ncbi:MAG: hypothetical protein ACX930_08200 [Erythrobacter sp.]
MNRAAASEFAPSRRGVLLGSVALATGAIVPVGCARLDLGVLNRLAFALFPHPPLSGVVYARLAEGFAEADRGAAERLASALPGGDKLSEWIGANLGNADLIAFRFAVLTGLYGDLEVTSAFGYQGPSIEFGGYLENGFDDLDWLPEPEL